MNRTSPPNAVLAFLRSRKLAFRSIRAWKIVIHAS